MHFIFVSVATPRKSSKQVALEKTSLHSILSQLLLGVYIIGDAAYTVSDQMLVPFTASSRQHPSKGVYSYFLTQLHIWIEMSFALLTNKLQALQSPMITSLSCSSKIIMTPSMLYNFVIAEDSDNDPESLQTVPGFSLHWGYCPTTERLNSISGTSHV